MLFVSLVLIFLVTFLVAVVVTAVVRAVLRVRDGNRQGLIDTLSELEQDSPALLKPEALSSISLWDSFLARCDFVEIMKARIGEAALNWSVGRVTALMLLSAAVGLGAAINIRWVPGWAGLLAGIFSALVPYLFILRRRARRFRKLREQFPEALDFLARALSAGHPFAAGLEMLASQTAAPLGAELRKTWDERKLGLSWDQALGNLAARVPLVEVSVFAAAVRLQNKTGGKLHEVFGKLAETMRDSVALEDEVRAIAAHGRVTGAVLTILPLVIVVIITSVNPSYFVVLLKHPNGKDMIAAAIICLLLAHFSIRKIVDIRI
jgi:tight adherence protein B